MIEQGIFFALGCIITALSALAFAPIFWSRALRLTRERVQLQVPLSMREILADRDQLRAEFAVERLRIEQAMERVKETRARDMAVIGRMSVEASQRTDEITSLRRGDAAQGREISLLMREATEAGAEAGALKKALDDAHAAGERHQDYARWAHDIHENLRQEAADRTMTISAMEVRAAELEARLTEMTAAVRDTRIEDGLRGRLETAVRHAARHEASGLSIRRELDEAKTLIRSLEEETETSRQALAEGREREKGLHLQRSLQVEKTRGQDRLGEQLELLRAENLALQESLASTNGPDVRASSTSSDDDLRASIHELGLAVASMIRDAQTAPEDPRVVLPETGRIGISSPS